jgi:nucleoredoxin
MPWLAVPFGENRINSLSSRFKVDGIPTLVMIDIKAGKIINKDCKISILEDPKGLNFPYLPEPIADLGIFQNYYNIFSILLIIFFKILLLLL